MPLKEDPDENTESVHKGPYDESQASLNAPEHIRRLLSLGLTAQEANAWYRRDIIVPSLKRGILLIASASAIALLVTSPLLKILQSTLTFHMIALHIALIFAGFIFAYGLSSLKQAKSPQSGKNSRPHASPPIRPTPILNKRAIVFFTVAALITAYWQIPANFDATVVNESVHFEMHFALVIVGSLIFLGFESLTRKARYIVPIVAGKAMGLYGAFLLLTATTVYTVYPQSGQVEAGLTLLLTMVLVDFSVVPIWLYDYFGKNNADSHFHIIRQS